MDLPEFLSPDARAALRVRGILRRASHHGSREGLAALLDRKGLPRHEAVLRLEDDVGGLIGTNRELHPLYLRVGCEIP